MKKVLVILSIGVLFVAMKPGSVGDAHSPAPTTRGVNTFVPGADSSGVTITNFPSSNFWISSVVLNDGGGPNVSLTPDPMVIPASSAWPISPGGEENFEVYAFGSYMEVVVNVSTVESSAVCYLGVSSGSTSGLVAVTGPGTYTIDNIYVENGGNINIEGIGQ